MKYLIVILLALLLTGCAVEEPKTAADTVSPTQETLSQDTTEPPVEEKGTYVPESAVEARTEGAVRAYDVGTTDGRAIYPMGEKMLLLSGFETTTLTVLEGEQLSIGGQRTLDCLLFPASGSVQIEEKGIAYYNDCENAVIFLDTTLRETRRVALPENVQGSPVISPDWGTVYYCTTNAVNALDLHTGLPRLLKEHKVASQTLTGLYFGGSVLCCEVSYEDRTGETVYLSAQTGETLYSDRELTWLYSDEDTYLAAFEDGSVSVYLTGTMVGEPQMLRVSQTAAVYPLFDQNAAAVMETADSVSELRYLDLETGKMTSAIRFGYGIHVSFAAGGEDLVWLIAGVGDTGKQFVYCWDPARSRVRDSESYYQPYYTAENPDTVGLAKCKAQAEVLGETYGVDILIGEDALLYQPGDYSFEMEYRVAAYERDLEALESALAQFPAGFFKDAAAGTSNGRLTISLVRSLNSDESQGSLENSDGVQYWLEESAYMALTMGRTLEQTFYHELSHVIDNRVISTTLAYDDWMNLNPEDFAYDYSYISNRYREDWEYLGEENRAFIDMYAMSYPREDRARILEYAMLPDCGSYFASEIMQNKLRTLCLGIREAFALDSLAPYPWEQYLNEPLQK